MLSGGIDSTYLAWKMVKEKTPRLHLHHISIRNNAGLLWEIQDARIPYILDYLKTIWPSFWHSESIYDFSGFRKVGWDSDIVLLAGQKIAQNYPAMWSELIIGWNPFDMERRTVAERAERKVTSNLWAALVESANNRENIDKKLHFPLIEQNITKSQMIKEMPKELLDLTWSCRIPKNNEPCGHCHACKEVKEAYKKIEKEAGGL